MGPIVAAAERSANRRSRTRSIRGAISPRRWSAEIKQVESAGGRGGGNPFSRKRASHLGMAVWPCAARGRNVVRRMCSQRLRPNRPSAVQTK